MQAVNTFTITITITITIVVGLPIVVIIIIIIINNVVILILIHIHNDSRNIRLNTGAFLFVMFLSWAVRFVLSMILQYWRKNSSSNYHRYHQYHTPPIVPPIVPPNNKCLTNARINNNPIIMIHFSRNSVEEVSKEMNSYHYFPYLWLGVYGCGCCCCC